MCLVCTSMGVSPTSVHPKFHWVDKNNQIHYFKSHVMMPNGDTLLATDEFLKEIETNALAAVSTGVDCQVDIWSIQWPSDYQVKHFPTVKVG